MEQCLLVMEDSESCSDHVRRKKFAAVFPESEIKDRMEKQLIFNEGLYDESDCTWLSSDCESPSLLSSDDPQSVWELDSSLDEELSSCINMETSRTTTIQPHNVFGLAFDIDYSEDTEYVRRKKSTAIFLESEIDDKIEKELIFNEGLYDESGCAWLSSDCESPSLLSSDDSQSIWEFDSSLDEELSSCINLETSRTTTILSHVVFGLAFDIDYLEDTEYVRRKKSTAIFLESEIDNKIEKELIFNEGLYDESGCAWLSSDCESPSLLSSDDPQSIWEFDSSLDEELSSCINMETSKTPTIQSHDVFGLVFDIDYLEDSEYVRRKKSAAILSEPEIEDTIEKQLIFNEGLYDESDCTWLSLDCKSPSLFSFDDPQCVWEFDSSDFSLDEQLSSTLSLSEKNMGPIFDGSVISPIEEASLVLTDFGDSSYKWSSLCEDSSMFESSSTSISTHGDTPSSARVLDRTGIDLDCEYLDLVQTREQGSDIFGPDFPSPCCSRSDNSAHDEPLFWPFDLDSYWSLESFLCLPPCKDAKRVGVQGRNESKPIRSRLHQKIKPSSVGKENRQGCRRILFGSTPKSATADRGASVPCNNGASLRFRPRNLSMNRKPLQLKTS